MNTRNAILVSCLLLGAVNVVHADDDIGPGETEELLKAGTIKPIEQLNTVALSNHPDAMIGDTELENEYGKYVYKVELRDSAGQEWEVDIDASSGAVLADKQDD